jgi:hypothetical protein
MEAVPADGIVTVGGRDRVTPGMFRLMVCVDWIPSPEAVTVIASEPNGADEAAASVRVAVPIDDESVAGLLLHEAFTPGGRPAMLRATGVLKDPPAVRVRLSETVWPGMTVI